VFLWKETAEEVWTLLVMAGSTVTQPKMRVFIFAGFGAPRGHSVLSLDCIVRQRRAILCKGGGWWCEHPKSKSFAPLTPRPRCCPRGPKPLRSATVCCVKHRVMEKTARYASENANAFSAFPQPRRLLSELVYREFTTAEGCRWALRSLWRGCAWLAWGVGARVLSTFPRRRGGS
jgi:hypothetical protein